MSATLFARLGAAFAVHPNGPTPVSEIVADGLAERTRDRARIIAWVGFLSAFPLFYLDHWRAYETGVWATTPAFHAQMLAWRVVSCVTLGAYLVWDRRAPASHDRRLARAFLMLAVVQAAWFGIWFETNAPSYPMYSFLLLFLAILLQPPSAWAVWVFSASVPIVVVGALLIGTAPALVAEYGVAFGLSTLMVVVVERVVYRQAYQTLESEHLLRRANEALREAQQKLVATERQAERLRISRDLHDSVGAQLSNLLAGVELARLENGQTDVMDEVEGDAREAMQQLRETVWALGSESISAGDLAVQLRRFAEARTRHGGIGARVRVSGDAAYMVPAAHALHLYRIGQEAVQNAVKHSGASQIHIVVAPDASGVSLSVSDDGTFRPPVIDDAAGAPTGFGMQTMRDRAEALGGCLSVETESGTTVRAAIPHAMSDQSAPVPDKNVR